jgi:hypothetical protein
MSYLGFFGPFPLEPFWCVEPFPAKAGVAARVRTTGVAYAAFFNSSLRLVRVSKTGWAFFAGIKTSLSYRVNKKGYSELYTRR